VRAIQTAIDAGIDAIDTAPVLRLRTFRADRRSRDPRAPSRPRDRDDEGRSALGRYARGDLFFATVDQDGIKREVRPQRAAVVRRP
jgi:hypothetical protein